MGEKLIDDLARALAQPMPRRRAVRVIAASLAAVTVPGISPRIGRSATAQGCKRICPCKAGHAFCWTGPNLRGEIKCNCCGFPVQRYACVGDGLTCVDECLVTQAKAARKLGKTVTPTSSKATNACGEPLRYACCLRPDQIPSDGECLPNCAWLYPGQGYAQCGAECCPPGQVCKVVQGKKKCVPCANTCKPPKGKAICCERGEQCCFNNKTAACCGPEQTCNAQNVKQATCICDTGTKCGSDCCKTKKGETCCAGLGTERCCGRGEECCAGDCCSGSAICCDIECCDPKKDEFCLAKQTVAGSAIAMSCKKGCTQANRCGPYCCGTGTRCVKGKCVT